MSTSTGSLKGLHQEAVLDKIKRPGGVFSFDMVVIEATADAVWLFAARDSHWRAPHDEGVFAFDALAQLVYQRPFALWWVDYREGRRLEADICLPPVRTSTGWSYVDLELDPVRHETTGLVEIEDHDEFELARTNGWMSPQDAQLAERTSQEVAEAFKTGAAPCDRDGWDLLAQLQRQDRRS